MRKWLISALALGLMLVTIPALAQDGTIVIELEGVVRGAEGDVVPLVSEPVPADLVGAECSGSLSVANNNSVHPNNNLIISTGGDSGTIPDVESEPGVTLELEGTLTVGETIDISIEFGPNGVTSGGLTLTLVCAQVEQTTTTTVAETTTTTAEATTTTAQAPVGGVETGAGGTAADSPNLLIPGAAIVMLAAAGVVALARSRQVAREHN